MPFRVRNDAMLYHYQEIEHPLPKVRLYDIKNLFMLAT